ncbi:MAG: PDZ domain-containing protein [Bacteroidales bacterium]
MKNKNRPARAEQPGNLVLETRKVFMHRGNHYALISIAFLMLFAAREASSQKAPASRIVYTVSMENPNNHYFHVALVYSGISEKSVELKLPVWTPGYYMIMDYPKYVVNFKATNELGKSLNWEKTSKNRWKIETSKTISLTVQYDVFAFRTSVADSFLDDGRGFISPTGIFMHPAGHKDHPVIVIVLPYEKFTQISTGLDPSADNKNTFYAANFDILYDCPILTGNQEILKFETGGIPYTIAAENLGGIDRSELTTDFRKIAEATTSIIGEIPYNHYTFIMMNRGMGGLEHTNSMAVFTNRLDFSKPASKTGWLSFIAHEFFHLYNVKTIRPVALGPFDYDKENYTTMLWFSEGVTVYYEHLILNRAGFLSREDFFRELKSDISAYENIPGHLFQSAAQSSYDSWMLFFNRSENAANTTISYYDKGCGLGLLLDLAIRHESGNKKSLDDVMRTLYQVYYKEKKRGFTDPEFREVCEKTATASLSEIFDVYIPTVQNVDYSKYLAYAGLSIDTDPTVTDEAWLGINTREDNGNLLITGVEWDSPAYKAGLSPQDIIKEINGEKATAELLKKALNPDIQQGKISLSVTHRDINNTVEVVPGKKSVRSFEIKPMPDPTPKQKAILEKWLK